MEDAKLLPAGAVWDYFCARQGVPVGEACAALAQAELPDDEPVDAAIARWFSRWIRNGVLRDSLRLPTDATPSDPRPAPALAAMS